MGFLSRWVGRPGVCRALEEHHRKTGDARYKGHVERGACAYEDRDRDGIGPF